MAFTSATALRKVTNYTFDDDLRLKRGYYDSTHLDHVVGAPCSLEYPASVCPPVARKYHYALSAAVMASVLLSRQRHQEKWWIGGVVVTTGFFVCAKFDESGSGIQAHNAGTLVNAFSAIALTCRTIAGSGNRSFNLKCIALCLVGGWYEFGMSHIWTAYITHFKQEATGRASAFRTSLWTDYVPQHIDPVFVHYHPLHTAEGLVGTKIEPERDWRQQLIAADVPNGKAS